MQSPLNELYKAEIDSGRACAIRTWFSDKNKDHGNGDKEKIAVMEMGLEEWIAVTEMGVKINTGYRDGDNRTIV